MIVNVTDLSSYMYCPRTLYMQKIMRIREPLNKAMATGLLKHSVMESASKSEKQAVMSISKETSGTEFETLFSRIYSDSLERQLEQKESLLLQFEINPEEIRAEIKQRLLQEAKSRSDEIYGFSRKNCIFGFELWESLVPKVFSEVRVLSKELSLQGRIDKVEIYPDKCIVHELKTGKIPEEVWPSHRIQASAYCMLAERKFNKRANESVLNYGTVQKKILMNPFMQAEVSEITAKVISMIESKIEPEECKRIGCRCKL